jgi:hypothetical protein
VGRSGSLWIVVGRCGVVVGRCEVVVGRCGSLWGRCGSLWVVVGCCGSFHVLVTTRIRLHFSRIVLDISAN